MNQLAILASHVESPLLIPSNLQMDPKAQFSHPQNAHSDDLSPPYPPGFAPPLHNLNLIPQPNNKTEPYSHINLSHSSLQEATPQPSSPPHLPENHVITPLAQALKPQTLSKDTSYNSNQTPTHKRKVQQLQKFTKRLKITIHNLETVFSDSGTGESLKLVAPMMMLLSKILSCSDASVMA